MGICLTSDVVQHGSVNPMAFEKVGRLEVKRKCQDRSHGPKKTDSVGWRLSLLCGLMDNRPDKIMSQDRGRHFAVHVLDLFALQNIHLEYRFEGSNAGFNLPSLAIQFDNARSRVFLGV